VVLTAIKTQVLILCSDVQGITTEKTIAKLFHASLYAHRNFLQVIYLLLNVCGDIFHDTLYPTTKCYMSLFLATQEENNLDN